MRTSSHPVSAAAALACVFGCGGAGSGGPAIPGLSVGGTYDTKVDLQPGGTCGNVTTADNPTVVDHAAGSSSLSLTHAGNTYPGSIDRTGTFSTPMRLVGGSANVAISGLFSTTGFEATVHVQQVSPACGYDVRWVGTKTGAPNTIP